MIRRASIAPRSWGGSRVQVVPRRNSMHESYGRAPRSRFGTGPAAFEEEERRDDGRDREEREDDVLVMRPRRIEQVVYGEKVDVVQHDQEGGGVRPEEDEDRHDRMGSHRSRSARRIEC